MMKKQFLHALLLLAGMFSFNACEQETDPCLEPRTASLRLGTYRRADTGTAIIDTQLRNALFTAIDFDTVQYSLFNGPNANKFILRLSPLADSTRWVIQPDTADSGTDTITFYYTRRREFLSTGCGYANFYTLTKVTATGNGIDSVRISAAEVNTNANAEHIKIYY